MTRIKLGGSRWQKMVEKWKGMWSWAWTRGCAAARCCPCARSWHLCHSQKRNIEDSTCWSTFDVVFNRSARQKVSVSRYSHRDYSRGCKCTMLIHFWNMKPKYMLYYLLRELSLGLISRCHAPRMRMHAHVNIDSRLWNYNTLENSRLSSLQVNMLKCDRSAMSPPSEHVKVWQIRHLESVPFV